MIHSHQLPSLPPAADWRRRKGEHSTWDSAGLGIPVAVKWSPSGPYEGLYSLEVAFNYRSARAQELVPLIVTRVPGVSLRDPREPGKGAVMRSRDSATVLAALRSVIDIACESHTPNLTRGIPKGQFRNRNERLAALGAPAGPLENLWDSMILVGKRWKLLEESGLPSADAAESVRTVLESLIREAQILRGERPWRITHVSRGALELIAGVHSSEDVPRVTKQLQRAHGLLDRLERSPRDRKILEGLVSGSLPNLSSLMDFHREHDATVLILRQEHFRDGGKWLTEGDLAVVEDRELFPDGKGVGIRLGCEVRWARAQVGAPWYSR